MNSGPLLKRTWQALHLVVRPDGTGWYVSSYALSFGLNVLFTVIGASGLGARAFGTFTLFTTLAQLGVSIVNAGFYTSGLTKAGVHSSTLRSHALLGSRLTTSLTLFHGLCVMVAAPLIAVRPDLTIYCLMAAVYIWLTASQPLWFCQIRGQHAYFNNLQILQRVLFVLPALLILRAGLSLPWVCLAWACSPLASALWFYSRNPALLRFLGARTVFSRHALRVTWATLSSEGKFLLVDLLATITASIPTLLIARTSSLADLGAYSLADRFRTYAITVFSPLNSAQYTRLCLLNLQGLTTKASILLSRYLLVVMLISSGLGAIAAAIIPSHLQQFGEGQYVAAQNAFTLFTIFVPILTVAAGFNLLYFSSQRITSAQYLSCLLRVLLFFMAYGLTHQVLGSITAAAISSIISEILTTLIIYATSLERSRLKLRLW